MQKRLFERRSEKTVSGRRGFALGLTFAVAVVLFIFMFSLFTITGEERGQAARYINKIRCEHAAESVHAFLLSKAFASSWDNRFFKEVKLFSSSSGNEGWQKELNESMKESVGNDIGYEGSISSQTEGNLKIIIIKVLVSSRELMKNNLLCSFRYYDLYKRNLLDSLGEPVSIFYDLTEESQKAGGAEPIPPMVVNGLKGSGSIDFDGMVKNAAAGR